MAYETPEDLNISEGFGRLLTYTNDVTGSLFANLILITLFVIVTMSYYRSRNNVIEALAIGSYSTFLIATLFYIAGFIVFTTFTVVISFMLLFTLALFLDKK